MLTIIFALGLMFVALNIAKVDIKRWDFPLIVLTSVNFLFAPPFCFFALAYKLVRESEYEMELIKYRQRCGKDRRWRFQYGLV